MKKFAGLFLLLCGLFLAVGTKSLNALSVKEENFIYIDWDAPSMMDKRIEAVISKYGFFKENDSYFQEMKDIDLNTMSEELTNLPYYYLESSKMEVVNQNQLVSFNNEQVEIAKKSDLFIHCFFQERIYEGNGFNEITYTVKNGIVSINPIIEDFTFEYRVNSADDFSTEVPCFSEEGTYLLYYHATSEIYQEVYGTLEIIVPAFLETYTMKVYPNAPEKIKDDVYQVFYDHAWLFDSQGEFFYKEMFYVEDYTFDPNEYDFSNLPIYYVDGYEVSYEKSGLDITLEYNQEDFAIGSNKTFADKTTVLDICNGLMEGKELIGWGLKGTTSILQTNQRFYLETVLDSPYGENIFKIKLIDNNKKNFYLTVKSDKIGSTLIASKEISNENQYFRINPIDCDFRDFTIQSVLNDYYFTMGEGILEGGREPRVHLYPKKEEFENQTFYFLKSDVFKQKNITSTLTVLTENYKVSSFLEKGIVFQMNWEGNTYLGDGFDEIKYSVVNGKVDVKNEIEDFVFTYSLSKDGEYTSNFPEFDCPGTYTVYYIAESQTYLPIQGEMIVEVPKFVLTEVSVDYFYCPMGCILFFDLDESFTITLSFTESCYMPCLWTRNLPRKNFFIYYKIENENYEDYYGSVYIEVPWYYQSHCFHKGRF